MTKNEFRSFFASCKDFLKMRFFLQKVGIAPSSFSLFMRGEEWNYTISLSKLQHLYDEVMHAIEKIA